MKTFAFFADTTILPGLHVSLLTLLDSLQVDSGERYRVVVFTDHVSDFEKQAILRTASLVDCQVSVEVRDFSPFRLPGANALHGNETAYGRLFLADLLPDTNECVYLDSDLIIRTSVDKLFSLFDGVNVLLADGTQKFTRCLDISLFEAAGLDLSKRWFNSGVLGIDLKLWRSTESTKQCYEVAQQFAGQFRSADQALLNIVFKDSFVSFGYQFNTPLYPAAESQSENEAILHLVGSPKPWDCGGRYVNNHFLHWLSWYKKTAIGKVPLRKYWSMRRVINTLPILIRTALKK